MHLGHRRLAAIDYYFPIKRYRGRMMRNDELTRPSSSPEREREREAQPLDWIVTIRLFHRHAQWVGRVTAGDTPIVRSAIVPD